MRKIIGITVGTPTSPKAMMERIKPVTSVNGAIPDENGNVELNLTEADKDEIHAYIDAQIFGIEEELQMINEGGIE